MAVIIAISMTALGSFCLWQRAQGPRCGGKTVEQWLAGIQGHSDLETNRAFRLMLAEIGTNATPPLLRILDQNDSILTRACRQISQNNRFPQPLQAAALSHVNKRQGRMWMAAEGLRLSGTNVAAAIPTLERMMVSTNDPVRAQAAWWALTGIGHIPVPVLIRLLSNAPPSRQLGMKPILEIECRRMLDVDDANQRAKAAIELSHWKLLPQEVIPALSSMCDSREAAHREAAVRSLSWLAPDFMAAAGAIVRRMTNSIYPDTRYMAREAVAQLGGIKNLKTFD